MNRNNRCFLFVQLFLLTMVLTACGGGGGTATPQDTSTSNNWGEMKWDQGSWK